MRIAIFTNNYLPNPFGVSGSIESFRIELEKLGHTVYVFAPKFKGYLDKNPNVHRYPAVDLKFRGIRFPVVIPYSCQLSRLLEKMEIDIVHAQHPNLLGWEARRWAKKKNVPLVFTWHTLYDQYTHFFPLVPSKLAAWWIIRDARKYANRADQVIVPTNSVQKIIKQWGVTNLKLSVIPTGVDEAQLAKPAREAIRRKYAIQDTEILLVVITRLTKEKNLEFLFNAVAKVLQKNKQVKFLVGGEGGLRGKLEKIAVDHDISAQVIFSGFIAAEVKKDYYGAGDIFVYASKSETQGMIISEAMYLGLPVVAVDAPGVRDLVTNQVTGFLVRENEVDFSKAVARLVADGDLRKRFAENAKKIARREYTADVCSQKLLAVYEKAILTANYK
jgi:1,2-diacylglycerol 3-alpha-glucosyltransferase